MRDKRRKNEAKRIQKNVRRPADIMAEGDVSADDVALHFVDLMALGYERPIAWLLVGRFVGTFK